MPGVHRSGYGLLSTDKTADKTVSQPASSSSRVLMDYLGLILAQTGCFGLYSKHGEQIAGVIMLLVGKMVKTDKRLVRKAVKDE